MRGTSEQRFWAKVVKADGPDSCWLWTGATTTAKGYGRLYVGGKWVCAHRFSWQLANGPIPASLEVDHRTTCVKRCVRPSHLRLATHKQNGENHAGAYRNSVSRVRGVSFHKRAKKWVVQVHHHGENNYGGLFVDIEEAEKAAIALRRKLFTHSDMDVQKLNTTTREGE